MPDPKTPPTDDDASRRTMIGSLGAGGEAAAGLHALQPDTPGAPPSDAQHGTPGAAGAEGGAPPATTGRGTEGDADRAGSEPLMRDHEHKGSYGGEGGSPRTSSDTREPLDPS
ncbi:MAG: hypothetical protein ACXW0Z_11485 [Gemmatirosa sp.]